MAAHVFIIVYKELSKQPNVWDESLFSLGYWPYPDSLPPDKIEDYSDVSPKWFSVHFWLKCDLNTPYDELRMQAKNHAREAFRQHHLNAELF